MTDKYWAEKVTLLLMSRHSNPMESCLLANENPRLTKMFSNNSHFLMHSSIKFIGPCVNASKRRFELSRRGLSYIVLTHLMPELCLLGNKLYLSKNLRPLPTLCIKLTTPIKCLNHGHWDSLASRPRSTEAIRTPQRLHSLSSKIKLYTL